MDEDVFIPVSAKYSLEGEIISCVKELRKSHKKLSRKALIIIHNCEEIFNGFILEPLNLVF
ncbi:hypothetical protein [Wolbachia endosymbiont of Atemnus politus]|uniref:hypothetical protein n=1 Tax=Wolbachia endosymbiont of Atemnus politus TaxID=2682840 RepID=UPI0015730755|nr:hypothetical protein [Wolbachia endosymbiont of Atemnus politus]